MFYSSILTVFLQIFTQIQSHSSYFVKKLSLNSANFAKNIFAQVPCCDKFHVCHQRALILKGCSLMTSSLESTEWRDQNFDKNRNRDFFSGTTFSEIETKTFVPRTTFPKPKLFSPDQNFQIQNRDFFLYQIIRNRNPPKIGKSLETEKFRNRNVNLWSRPFGAKDPGCRNSSPLQPCSSGGSGKSICNMFHTKMSPKGPEKHSSNLFLSDPLEVRPWSA